MPEALQVDLTVIGPGAVIGPPGLASTSVEQGRPAVRNAFLLKSHHFPEFSPCGIYTNPVTTEPRGPWATLMREYPDRPLVLPAAISKNWTASLP